MFCNIGTTQQVLLIVLVVVIVLLLFSWFSSGKNKNTGSVQNPIIIPPNYGQRPPGLMGVPPIETLANISHPNKSYILYYFYNPGCHFCKTFNPSWSELVERLKGYRDLETRAVDVTKPENENLAFYYNISKYPTIILVTPEKNIEYNGTRSTNDLHNFVLSNVQGVPDGALPSGDQYAPVPNVPIPNNQYFSASDFNDNAGCWN